MKTIQRKEILTTTLNEIRAHKPCSDDWELLLVHLGKSKADDDSLSFVEILESNGIKDALWALKCLDRKYSYIVRLFAAQCADSVLHNYEDKHPNDPRVRECIKSARQFALGLIDSATRSAARSAAYSAAESAARSAANSAAGSAAYSAAYSAADSAADYVADYAANSAAGYAADSAADSAAGYAAYSAADYAADYVANSAAGYAERAKQSEWFKDYFTEAKPIESYKMEYYLLSPGTL